MLRSGDKSQSYRQRQSTHRYNYNGAVFVGLI
jgi:hypothetical protein